MRGTVPLPDAFGLALFRPADERGILVLAIGEKPPAGFEVFAEHGPILDENGWLTLGRRATVELPWPQNRPPSYLMVRWFDGEERREAVWVINVTDGARLPPPEELRSLKLDELLEILTSARPLHQAMQQILRRRDRKDTGSQEGQDIERDPHRKVDTRNFLLRRMRRVAQGLEGLRERLERPAYHLEALRWRLYGPVGPVVLARKLVEQEPEAAAFMLSEVALTVHRADWKRVEALLGRQVVREEVRSVLDQLERLAGEVKAPPNLAGYVREAFAEIGS